MDVTNQEQPYSGILSAFTTLIVGMIVIITIKYRQYLLSFLVSKKKHVDLSVNQNASSNLAESECQENFDSNTDESKKIDRCTMLLKELNSRRDLQAMPTTLTADNIQLRKNLSDLTKRSKLMETDSVHDGDSMVVNFPYEEDHDEVDIADLTPDDITVSDEDENNDTNISPQAMADIEAELMDSSILDESLDESDKVTMSEQDEKNGTQSNQADADDINQEIETTVSSVLAITLDEIGSELLRESLSQDDLSVYAGTNEQGSKEKTRFDHKFEKKAVEEKIRKNDDQSCGDFIYDIGDKQSLQSKQMDEKIISFADEDIGIVSRMPEGLETGDARILPQRQQLSAENEIDGNREDSSSISNTCSRDKFSDLVKLVAIYVSNKAITDAREDLLKDVTSNETLAKAKMEKISKIHTEKQRLNEEELAEERRIQQNQLSDILTLMEENPQMFGSVTKQNLTEQANLYCI